RLSAGEPILGNALFDGIWVVSGSDKQRPDVDRQLEALAIGTLLEAFDHVVRNVVDLQPGHTNQHKSPYTKDAWTFRRDREVHRAISPAWGTDSSQAATRRVTRSCE